MCWTERLEVRTPDLRLTGPLSADRRNRPPPLETSGSMPESTLSGSFADVGDI
jgi:hypothetical protein